jgi:FlaA1/EpsC-like NDP-sugar epimerase
VILQIVGNALVIVSAALCWAFVVVYHVMSRGSWRYSLIGRHLMVSDGTVGTVLTLSVIRIIGGPSLDPLWFQVLRMLVFAAVPVVVAWRIWLMVRAQRANNEREHDDARHLP